MTLTRNNGETVDEIFTVDQDDRSFTIETDDPDLDMQKIQMVLVTSNAV